MMRVEHAVDIVLDVCDALVAAHENGIVHGQIAPHTVQVSFSFETGPRDVQIFSLTPEGDSGPSPALTPLIAPEQRDRERKLDARVDVWALGALLLTMVTGRPPSPGTVRVPNGAMPRSLADVVESCLSPDPERRPSTVIALAESIASFASSPPDRFEALAARRAVEERAKQQKERLERRGLADMPNVLDKLDDLALRRARGMESASIASVLDRPANERDLERLMKVVRENTEGSQATQLTSLMEEDDDEMNVLTTMRDEGYIPSEPVGSPLTTLSEEVSRVTSLPAPPPSVSRVAPAAEETAPPPLRTEPLVPPRTMPSAPAAHEVPISAPSRPRNATWLVVAAVVVCVGTTVVGFFGARVASGTPTPAAPNAAAAATTAAPPAIEPAPSAAPSASPKPIASARAATTASATTPTFSPSALPDAVLTVTPDSLPSAKKYR
ncbi:MAG: hypothetical protein JST00_39550 [Deltaproteobacteria bacterium]|nr:hypothetical protein [Deltaproteobacteria bacterium]